MPRGYKNFRRGILTENENELIIINNGYSVDGYDQLSNTTTGTVQSAGAMFYAPQGLYIRTGINQEDYGSYHNVSIKTPVNGKKFKKVAISARFNNPGNNKYLVRIGISNSLTGSSFLKKKEFSGQYVYHGFNETFVLDITDVNQDIYFKCSDTRAGYYQEIYITNVRFYND